MNVDSTFDANYYLELGNDLQGGSKVFRYPGASNEAGADGVLLDVFDDEGGSWTGVFAFGTFSSKGVTGVYHLPGAHRFCVVSNGAGYVVSAREPKDWEELPLVPILDVRCSKEQELLIFANDTELCAYGRDGLLWTTERLSWHDLKIKEVNESEVVAEYWNVRDEEVREVRVNLSNGNAMGAAEFV